MKAFANAFFCLTMAGACGAAILVLLDMLL